MSSSKPELESSREGAVSPKQDTKFHTITRLDEAYATPDAANRELYTA
jgi:hypothetical protein